jgi:hypothetical protein
VRKSVPFTVAERTLIAKAATRSGLSTRQWIRAVALAVAGVTERGAAARPDRRALDRE